MATILPFRALCPDPSLVAQIASPPYDVLSTSEARAMAADKPNSFLHIIKPEIDLQDVDPYAEEVYRQGAIEHFDRDIFLAGCYAVFAEGKPSQAAG